MLASGKKKFLTFFHQKTQFIPLGSCHIGIILFVGPLSPVRSPVYPFPKVAPCAQSLSSMLASGKEFSRPYPPFFVFLRPFGSRVFCYISSGVLFKCLVYKWCKCLTLLCLCVSRVGSFGPSSYLLYISVSRFKFSYSYMFYKL